MHSVRKSLFTLYATGLNGTVGGIASANRNILKALQTSAEALGGDVRAHVLHEHSAPEHYITTHSGSKLSFAAAVLASARSSRVAVFDHVGIAKPMLAIPKFLRPKIVICAHGSESWKRIKPSSIRLFQIADLVLANSDYTLKKMKDRLEGFEGITCALGLPPQFDLTTSPPVRKYGRVSLVAADLQERILDSRVMLLVARMDTGEREKGHRELIKVLPSVAKQVPNVQMVFVGEGSDYDHLVQLARQSKCDHRIFFAGKVSNTELSSLYNSAFAYVMPSRQEGFGLVFLEAMNYSLPCLGCHGDGAADVIVDGVTGSLVHQPISETELVNIIVNLLNDPARAEQMGLAGWRRLHSLFSSEAHQARIIEALSRFTK